jgi:serine phosphatase RsbU (regulator of sigma subunit)
VNAEQMVLALDESKEANDWIQHALLSEETTIRHPGDPYGPLGIALAYPPDYSSIAAPLRAGDRPLGILTLAHSTAGRYGSESRAMTATFASYAAVAIQNARLFRSAQEQAYISTVLLQVSETSQAATTVSELFESLARLMPLLVGIRKCAFYLWDEQERAFLLSASYGIDVQQENLLFYENDVPALAHLLETGQTLFVHDPVEELHLPAASVSESTGTLVLLPLTARGQVLGAFLVAHEIFEPTSQKAFNEQDLSILQGIAHQAAITVENIRLLDARQEEAYVTAVLLQVAQAVVSQNDLADTLDTIVHLMQILVGISTSAIYLWEKDTHQFQLAKSTGLEGIARQDYQTSYSQGEFSLLDTVFDRDLPVSCPLPSQKVSPLNWPMLSCQETGSDTGTAAPAEFGWLLGFPLSVKGEVYGVLVAVEGPVSTGLRERRMEIINGIAQQVSLAIQNERLNAEMVERERLEREIQLARQIQKTFLPNRLPQVEGWQMDMRWRTARQVGGDFYDVFRLNKGRMAFVIADVADKGMAAALYMTVTRTLIRAVSQNIESPARVLERVNRLLAVESPDSLFVTTVYLVLNPETGELLYTNAGHNRPLVIRSEAGDIEQLPLGGTAMGVINNATYRDQPVVLHSGDTLLMFTDGVTETFSPTGETFGDTNLSRVVQDWQAKLETENLMEEIENALRTFRQGLPPSDDMTLLSLHRL